jgi:hypothetical protein
MLDNSLKFNIKDLIAKLKLSCLKAVTDTNKSLKIEAKGILPGNSWQIKGLGFLQLNSGLDSIDVLNILSNDFELTSDFSLAANIGFPSSTKVQEKVASFSKNILDKGFGNTKEKVTLHSIQFGVNENDSFKLFSKVLISIPSSKIITQIVIDEILKAILGSNNDTKISNLSIDGSKNQNSLDLSVGATLRSNMEIEIGHVQYDTMISDARYSIEFI